MIRKRLVLLIFLATAVLHPLMAQEIESSEPSQVIQKKFADCYSDVVVAKSQIEAVKKIVQDPQCFKQPFLETVKEYIVISYFPTHYRNPLKECFYCQKIISGALQMYNLEHARMLRRINNRMLSEPQTPLIPEYLKHPFPRAQKECRYESIGDITKGGLFIYCTYHGSSQPIEELK